MSARPRTSQAQVGDGAGPATAVGTTTTSASPAAPEAETLDAAGVLAELERRFARERIGLACSFQKEEAVLLDLLHRSGALDRGVRVFALDTEVLFAETYELWRSEEQRLGITIEARRGIGLAEQAARHGEALWERDPTACCGLRKVAPLDQVLGELDAWITGVRRDQSPTRATAPKLGWDAAHGLWKANPLADWDDARVWAHITAGALPYNPLHDEGYASIGCTHCTRPGSDRDGRWADRAKTECGLHGDG